MDSLLIFKYREKMEKTTFGLRLSSAVIDLLLIISLAIVVAIPLGTKLSSNHYAKTEPQYRIDTAKVALPAVTPVESAELPEESGNPFAKVIQNFIGNLRSSLEFGLGLAAVLYGLVELFAGASPGKMIVNIKVAASDGSSAGFGSSFIRYLVKHLPWLLFILAGITYSSLLESLAALFALIVFIGCFRVQAKERRAMHDIISGTTVFIKN